MSVVSPLLAEPVVDLIIAQLKATLNPLLQTLDFKYADGISLAPIEKNSYYISDSIEPLTLPACMVLFGEQAFQYNEDQNYLISNDRVLVVVTVEELGDQSATKKVWRYGRAVYACLNLQRLVSPDQRVAINLILQNMAYGTSPVSSKMPDREKRFRKDVVMEFKIDHFEKNLTEV